MSSEKEEKELARRFLVAVLLVTLVAGLSMGVAAQEKKKVALILSGVW